MNQNKTHSLPVRALRKIVFKELFPHQNRMRTLTGLLGVYQRTGLQKIMHKSRLINILPENMSTMEKVLPKVPTLKEMKNRPNHLAALGTRKKRVAFFSGCLMDTMFLETNNATMKLLQVAGCEIVIPKPKHAAALFIVIAARKVVRRN